MAVDIELACNLIQATIATNLQPLFVANVPLSMKDYPTAMDDALCPYVLTWPGPGSWYQKGHGYKIDDRTCIIYVIIESLAQKDIPTRTMQGTRILQATRNIFATAGNLQLDSGSVSGYQIVVSSKDGTPQSDSGLESNLPFSGKPWFHFQIPLRVRIQWIA